MTIPLIFIHLVAFTHLYTHIHTNFSWNLCRKKKHLKAIPYMTQQHIKIDAIVCDAVFGVVAYFFLSTVSAKYDKQSVNS